MVIESRGAWWVDNEGRAFGPLSSKDEAIRHARDVADRLGDPRRRNEVWVPDSVGKMQLHWAGPAPRKVA